MRRILVIGSSIAVLLLLALAAVVFFVSIAIRGKLLVINRRMEELAIGTPDFSRRLSEQGDDELGKLVKWFNRLSDKLENDYKNIEQLSITDKLTGLNNRFRTDGFLSDSIAKARDGGSSLSVVFLDIDHFKSINDNHGDLVGDEVLKDVANLLKQSVDSTDFIGRWGGEEFVLVLPGKKAADARRQAEGIRQSFSAHPQAGLSVTASLGVSELQPGDHHHSLIKRADSALYRAKESGRDQVVAA